MNNYNSYNRLAVGSENTFLYAARLPARLDSRQVSAILGFQEHDIPVLVSAKLLKPLGKPASNSPKYFARLEIEGLTQDHKWLSIATQVIYDHWKKKNKNKAQGYCGKDSVPRFSEDQSFQAPTFVRE
jgi:hypothetical protein